MEGRLNPAPVMPGPRPPAGRGSSVRSPSILMARSPESGYPDSGVLAAVDQVRAGGLRVVIVTGRILAELEAVFPDAAQSGI